MKRVYVLVDVEQYDVVRRFPMFSLVAEGRTASKNEHRCSLIRRKFSLGINADEAHELAELQGELSAYRKQAAPLPYDAVDALKAVVNSARDTPAAPASLIHS